MKKLVINSSKFKDEYEATRRIMEDTIRLYKGEIDELVISEDSTIMLHKLETTYRIVNGELTVVGVSLFKANPEAVEQNQQISEQSLRPELLKAFLDKTKEEILERRTENAGTEPKEEKVEAATEAPKQETKKVGNIKYPLSYFENSPFVFSTINDVIGEILFMDFAPTPYLFVARGKRSNGLFRDIKFGTPYGLNVFNEYSLPDFIKIIMEKREIFYHGNENSSGKMVTRSPDINMFYLQEVRLINSKVKINFYIDLLRRELRATLSNDGKTISSVWIPEHDDIGDFFNEVNQQIYKYTKVYLWQVNE